MSTLWYTKPAAEWEEALPLGNGRLGAMIAGNLREERIQVNEETIWYGGWEDRLNPDARENLPKLRELVRQGRISEAEHLIRLAFISGPDGQRGYQTLGDIEMKYLNDPSQEECTAYRRELDLDRAVCRVQYENAKKEAFERTCFISRPADCMVLHLRAPKGKVSVEVMLNRAKYFDRTGKVNDHTIYLSGNLGKNALEFAMCLSAKAKGGRVYTMGKKESIIPSAEEVIDEVLISLFRAPHSYTGEDSTEIMCHGSSYILQQVIQLLIYNGCRAALPGEYTQRAFLNGKMDLSQAEAVADLIASSSAATHRLAMSQMRGGFSKELSNLRNQLLHFTSLMELELDFSDHEELEFANRDELSSLATHIEQVIAQLAHSFSVGNAIKNGIPVAIIGETNAGKSTLLNALLNEEKAIVSDIHGTTRDVIEDTINLQGVTFRFIDTAGIRQTNDTIENLGIERTFQKMDQAYVILWMIDSTDAQRRFEELKAEILPHCEGKKMIILFNKSDLLLAIQKEELSAIFADMKVEKLFISAKKRENITILEKKLVQAAALPEINQNDIIITNVRHYEALTRALDSIHRVQEGLQLGLSGDLVSEDLRQCIHELSEIVAEGGITSEETLQNIFQNFCIGK